jgi:glycosyltransferase involved in cell wall biosynthesis
MICITCPGFSIHGGIRVILEWANRLPNAVILNTSKSKAPLGWFKNSVPVTRDPAILKSCETLIITSPHGIHLQNHEYAPKRVFLFLQMMEHIFNEKSLTWVSQCMKFYKSPHPMILISHWNYAWCRQFGRRAPTYYVGNGVNLTDFPIVEQKDNDKTVLIEGWEAYNPAKDVDSLGPVVGKRLKADGYRILAYSQFPLKTRPDVPDEYYHKPDLKTLNSLYQRATILVKASRYDARALAPIEAMTKGTVTARAIIHGDDDLINDVTALRCAYEEEALYQTAKRLLDDQELRARLSGNCLEYVQKFSWDYYMMQIMEIIEGHPHAEMLRL